MLNIDDLSNMEMEVVAKSEKQLAEFEEVFYKPAQQRVVMLALALMPPEVRAMLDPEALEEAIRFGEGDYA